MTQFELEVLFILNDEKAALSRTIQRYGENRYHPDWAGPARLRKGAEPSTTMPYTYPRIDMALGRLARQGFVTRVGNVNTSSLFAHFGKSQCGLWSVTDTGEAYIQALKQVGL